MKTVYMRRFALSFGGTGYLRPAPGTVGSLAAIPAGLIVLKLGGVLGFLIAILGLFALGYWLIEQENASSEVHDPDWIVIDEVVGQWIAFLPVIIATAQTGVSATKLWPGLVAAFCFFRLFDIWKPGPVGWADRRDDAAGVMMDDVLAGVLAAICVVLLAVLAHMGFAAPPAP